MKRTVIGIFMLALLVGCEQKAENKGTEEVAVETHVLHKDSLNKMTPELVIDLLKSGNQDFVAKKAHPCDAMAQLVESAEDGQSPMAIVLSCIDARVPVEIIFNKGLGDLFVARVAGNIVNPDIIGSMEYACGHTGSKVVVVLGHESCGAVHAACEGVDEGNMTQMLAKIKPAIDSCSKGDLDPHSKDFREKVTYQNVRNMVDNVRAGSEMLRTMESEGKVKIVGAVFNLHTGLVEFI